MVDTKTSYGRRMVALVNGTFDECAHLLKASAWWNESSSAAEVIAKAVLGMEGRPNKFFVAIKELDDGTINRYNCSNGCGRGRSAPRDEPFNWVIGH